MKHFNILLKISILLLFVSLRLSVKLNNMVYGPVNSNFGIGNFNSLNTLPNTASNMFANSNNIYQNLNNQNLLLNRSSLTPMSGPFASSQHISPVIPSLESLEQKTSDQYQNLVNQIRAKELYLYSTKGKNDKKNEFFEEIKPFLKTMVDMQYYTFQTINKYKDEFKKIENSLENLKISKKLNDDNFDKSSKPLWETTVSTKVTEADILKEEENNYNINNKDGKVQSEQLKNNDP